VVRNKTDASSLQMSTTLCDHSRHIVFVMNVDFFFLEKVSFFKNIYSTMYLL
jgi:hypothetical protein